MDARRHPEGMNPADQASEQERIARAKAGDAEAWGELYHQYAPAIFRFCRRAMPTREDAEDATMDIFIKIRQKLSQYDSSRPFGAWLYTVAANHCWDLLPSRARMALVLRYYADMSYDEVAATLGVRRAFVGVVLLRARHQLRDILGGRGAMAGGTT